MKNIHKVFRKKKLRGIARKVKRVCSTYQVELKPYDKEALGANRYYFPIDGYRITSRVSAHLQSIILQKAIDETYRLIENKAEHYKNTKFVCLLEIKYRQIEINHFLDEGYYDYFFAKDFTREPALFDQWNLKFPAGFDAVMVPGYLPDGEFDEDGWFIFFGEVPLERPSLEGNSYLASMNALREKAGYGPECRDL